MYAAAAGHSNLGIPEEVGREFIKKDAEEGGVPPEAGDLTDFEVAEAIRDVELPSPQKYSDFWLFDLRITGTGMAYRDYLDEWAFRDPKKWLNEDFVQRCNGLSVIFDHPERAGLNTEEFRNRAIGTVVLPYVKGDEVWGIAKIFDADAALLMQTTHRSTSPGVMPPKGAAPQPLESGSQVLDEGLPLILDHLAICEAGVWDKDGKPEGIRLDSQRKGDSMPDEEKEKLEKERDDARARADTAEKELADAKSRHDAEEKEREDKRRRHDEDEEAAVKAAEKEREDARKKRHDAGKHDGAHKDCSRCDSEEKEEKEREEHEREDKRRKDGAPVEDVNANEVKELKDRALRHDAQVVALQGDIKSLTDRLGVVMHEPSIEDRNLIAQSWNRADTVYQMLGERAPLSIPGESPISYRRRLADGLRKYSPRWKEHAIHDSLTGASFDHIEKGIYDDALLYAKKPHEGEGFGKLIEVKRVENGKTYCEFFGDARITWAPFMTPTQVWINKWNKNPDGQRGAN